MEKMERASQPETWFDGSKVNDVLFCEDFLAGHPMKCIHGTFFDVNGAIGDAEQIKAEIYYKIAPYVTSGIAKKATTLLDALRIRCYSPPIPGLFRWGYNYSKDHPWVFRSGSGIYKILTIGAERLHYYIISRKFDAVICTHLFSAIILTHLMKRHRLSVKTAFVATDYTFYPGMGACNLQKYFIASKCLAHAYSNQGIPQEAIIASGIPVRQKFWKHTEKGDAKYLLGIGRKNKHLLMMGGSMGCGPMEKMLKRIVDRLPKNAEVSVICGTNRQLYRKLNVRYRNHPRVHIVGYTDKMPLYMDSADLYLTKPGGISVTEAAVKNIPMSFINAVAGCEQYNMCVDVTDDTL